MKLIVLACLFAMTFATDDKTFVLCGRRLANARVLLCYGTDYIKRSATHSLLLDYLDDDIDIEIDWPWSGRRGSITADWSRYKRNGLADECCMKPCNTDVILSYC